MGEHAESHSKILTFLMGEWARKDNRQLVAVELLFSPGGGFKDESVRKWVRADEPELFAEFVNIEKLVTQILEIAEGETDAKPPGKHRFVVRTHQHMGERATTAFAMSPAYRGADDVSLVPAGGGGAGGGRDQQVLANHAGQLMRINAQMFEGTIRVLSIQTQNLHEQNAALMAENITLRRELEEARSNQLDREFNLAMAHEKNARTKAAFDQVMQIGSVVAAKFMSGGEQPTLPGGADPATSALKQLLIKFYESLQPQQVGAIMSALEMGQKVVFMEIVRLVSPPPEPNGNQQSPPQPAPNGAATSR